MTKNVEFRLCFVCIYSVRRATLLHLLCLFNENTEIATSFICSKFNFIARSSFLQPSLCTQKEQRCSKAIYITG